MISTSMNLADLSVVIPAYNAEKWLERSVESALNQGKININIIIVDDGSKDDTLKVANRLASIDSAKIRILSGPNRGAAVARNWGLSVATSRYIIFLDADDYIIEGSLSEWLAVVESEGADILFGPFCTDHDGELRRGDGAHADSGKNILGNWFLGKATPPCAVLWRTEFIREIGGWRPILKNDDGELGIRALLEGAKVALANSGMGVWVQHDSLDRISRRRGANVLLSEYHAFLELEALAFQKNVDVSKHLCFTYYRIARESFDLGIDDLAAISLLDARRLGLIGHPGPIFHKMLAWIFGLKIKSLIARKIRSGL